MSNDIKCIRRTTKETAFTWCGKYASPFMRTFPSLDAAAQNGHDEGALLACEDCVNEALKGLQHGSELHAKLKADALKKAAEPKFPEDSLTSAKVVELIRAAGITTSQPTFYKWCDSGKFPLPDYRILQTRRWKLETVQNWLRQQGKSL